MPTFKFKAKKLTGEEIEETREAKDEYELARSLKQGGYILIDFDEEGKKRKFSISISLGGISASEKMIFTRNLAVMIGAGLPISRAFTTLIRQAKNRQFKNTLTKILEELSKGKNLSDILAQYKKIFSDLYVAMVKAGEKSGKLEEALNIVADQMEKDIVLKRKIKGAMVYPAIVVVAMFGIGIFMLIYVVPTLVSTFQELEIKLPMSTRFIIWLSNSLVANSILLLAGLAVLVFAFVLLLKNKKVAKAKDWLFLRSPMVSPLTQKLNAARAARTLSSLVSSGVEIIEALDITSEVLQNIYFRRVLTAAKEQIQKGSTISAPFKEAENIFPALFGEMVAVGEETGKLSDMLLRLAVFYEEQVAESTKDLATIIEPVLMVVIGFAVGFFAVSMIKPMYSMMGGL